jgi:pyridoxine 4-dehydrogenase
MQITGPAVWGEPAERGGAIAVLRCAVELGVDFIDTAGGSAQHRVYSVVADREG